MFVAAQGKSDAAILINPSSRLGTPKARIETLNRFYSFLKLVLQQSDAVYSQSNQDLILFNMNVFWITTLPLL